MEEGLAIARRRPIIVPADAMVKVAQHGKAVDLRKLGIFPGIAGGAEGYNQVGDVVTQTSDGRDLNQIWADFQAALQLYNSQRDRLLGMLTFNVTQPIEDVFQGGDTVDFERASEFGVPRGIRAAVPTFFSLGYDFDWWDIAIRYTWKFLAEATQPQVDSLNNSAIEADNRLQFNDVMRAIFNDVTRTATIRANNYNVYPFYNGDSTVPPRWKQNTLTAPHTHYLVSGGSAVVSGDLDDIETHLKHHGYGWEQGTALILLANSAQTAVIKTFRQADGDSFDFIASAGTPSWAIPTDLAIQLQIQAGATPPSSVSGMPVIGRYGPWLIVEEDMVPADYLLGLASGGAESAQNPVGIREHANAGLRGLRLVKGPDQDYPLIESYYQRGFGTGIRQRGAGVVMQVKASGDYEIPAAYV